VFLLVVSAMRDVAVALTLRPIRANLRAVTRAGV